MLLLYGLVEYSILIKFILGVKSFVYLVCGVYWAGNGH